MRKISYMDALLPNEIDLNDDDLEIYHYYLEEYCRLYLMTEKWHKYKSNAKKNFINLFTKEEKKKLNESQLSEYWKELENYYDYTKMIDNSKERKIIRLKNDEENRLTDEEYALYLKQLRIYDDNLPIRNISLSNRKKLVPLLRSVLKLDKLASGIKLYKMNTKLPKVPDNRPIIFVLTHVGKDDQTVFSNVVKKSYLTLSGDYESLHNNIEGKFFAVSGIEFFDMRSKKERKEIVERVAKRLKEGNYILCSMEGAWNLSSNCNVLELFSGMIKSAIDANAVIIPVGIERFNKKMFGINVSDKYFDPLVYDLEDKNEKELIDKINYDLRQILADLKMQLYFHKKINKKITTSRASIGDYDKYNEEFKKDILRGWTFTEEDVREKAYRNKNNPEIAFDYLIEKYNNIKPLYELVINNDLSEELKDKIKEKIRKLLSELISDIKNPIYPNRIHNALIDIFFDLEFYFDIALEQNNSYNLEKVKK